MKFFQSNDVPRQKVFVGNNLVIITEGSSPHSASPAGSDGNPGFGPTALTTVSGTVSAKGWAWTGKRTVQL